ncbi:MAG TPA: prepilin-type N-terminal cleavage/methylation domain-containing protein, partial [Thermoanaerobaculia bacterium]|nr:prepilin-type N-terminal cleavage/methylation domain-containing protein [Thermoanaerobaculia bacterium]
MRTRAEAPLSRGFTLVEMLVTMVIVMIVMIGLLTMLESGSRVAKQESAVAGAQAANRSGLFEVSRILRQARTGRLYGALSVLPYANNAPAGTTIVDLQGAVHTLREGTDAVEARGIFRSEMDYFSLTDVSCASGPCTGGSDAITVSIPQTAPQGFENYPAGGKPAAANRSRSFYYVVTTTLNQNVTAGTNVYSTSLYYVGRVSPASVTSTAASTSFVLDATDVGARAMDASSDTSLALQKPFSGGVLD